MTVEQARAAYLHTAMVAARLTRQCVSHGACGGCQWWWLQADAASIVLDMAVAEHVSGRRPCFREPGRGSIAGQPRPSLPTNPAAGAVHLQRETPSRG